MTIIPRTRLLGFKAFNRNCTPTKTKTDDIDRRRQFQLVSLLLLGFVGHEKNPIACHSYSVPVQLNANSQEEEEEEDSGL